MNNATPRRHYTPTHLLAERIAFDEAAAAILAERIGVPREAEDGEVLVHLRSDLQELELSGPAVEALFAFINRAHAQGVR